MGIAAFVVDSFGPRDVGQTATDQSQLSTAVKVADALAALKLLATHPRVDPGRIGTLGFSKFGHVAFYPYCSDWYLSGRVGNAPMLFLLGGQDGYTPAAPCRDYAGWFRFVKRLLQPGG